MSEIIFWVSLGVVALVIFWDNPEPQQQQINCFALNGEPACVAHDLQGNFLWASWNKTSIETK